MIIIQRKFQEAKKRRVKCKWTKKNNFCGFKIKSTVAILTMLLMCENVSTNFAKLINNNQSVGWQRVYSKNKLTN